MITVDFETRWKKLEMRTGLSTIQQTLTPEAASILNRSIAEAGRRNHGQTTPLHVAATLLASPAGYLRQACIRSHPNSSHPLQCRALELCFSVALERLPAAQNLSPGMEPPISNALMAALKRAQAHQRRGCPEQQQQPLLAVKVELEQLIISILDDPSVSRVMREAGFSSPAVKVTIEQSLSSSNSSAGKTGLPLRPNQPISRNMYLNPRLQKQQKGNIDPSGHQRKEEVEKVIDILLKSKKRNPVLIGETEPDALVREVLQRIEKREVTEGPLQGVQVVSLEKESGSTCTQVLSKMKELGDLIEARISSCSIAGSSGGVILDLGDLKWMVQQQQTAAGLAGFAPVPQQNVMEAGRVVVSEMGKLVAKFREGSGGVGGLWLIGTATCETFLRCQVYHQTIENDWDLQVVPIAARSPMPGLFPRIGGNGTLSSSVGTLSLPMKGPSMGMTHLVPNRPSENAEKVRESAPLCAVCMGNYEQELNKVIANEKSSSDTKPEVQRTLPQWMQTARLINEGSKPPDQLETKDHEQLRKQSGEELMKKWNTTCRQLHPAFHLSNRQETPSAAALSVTSACAENLLERQSSRPKITLAQNQPTLHMNCNPFSHSLHSHINAPRSPVKTELVLGCPRSEEECIDCTGQEQIKGPNDAIPFICPDKISEQANIKLASAFDADSLKRLLKGLTEKVAWQTDAALVVARSVIETKSGNGKQRSNGAKGDTWLMFAGPDKVGKKKMAMALSEMICLRRPTTIQLGLRIDNEDQESEVKFRGKTVLDRIVEAVRRNPFSVIVLEDFDKADILVRGGIKRAMQKGRLLDSHGREIGLGSVIFILTVEWCPESNKSASDALILKEQRLAADANRDWWLCISLDEKMSKRRAEWACKDGNKLTKLRKDAGPGLSLDLNLAVDMAEEDAAENSSDLTFEHGHDLSQSHGNVTNKWLLPPSTHPSLNELVNWADDIVVFKPVDFSPIQTKVMATIKEKFASVINGGWPIEMDDEALEKIVGGAWFGKTGFEEWVDHTLVPGFQQLKQILPEDENGIIRLVPASSCLTTLADERNTVVVEGL